MVSLPGRQTPSRARGEKHEKDEAVTAVEFTRWFLALFFLGVAGFYTLRILALKARRGRSPVYSGKRGSWHFLSHLAFRVFRAAILLVCVVRLVEPGLDRYLIPIMPFWHPVVLLAGCLLLLLSFAAVVALHFAMGETWRSGSPEDQAPRLITSGAFAHSRNPMLLGVQGAQFGFFLALPSVFSLLCLAVGLWAVHTQARVEEAMLERQLGEAYRRYRERTPRWLVI